ncbi:MAG: maleylpyruvate isomerase family mycothiol-dependent enzyme [Microthrixaceae bacterium]
MAGEVVDGDTIRAWTAEERRRAAKDLRIVADAAWDRPSLCAGWKCRDVLGHLVWLAESTRPRAYRDVALTCRPPGSAIRRIGRRHGEAGVDELLDRLDAAAEGGFFLPGAGPQAALVEVLTHRADITRVTEGPTRSSDERTRLVVNTLRDYWWFYGVPRRVRSARLVADDAGFEVGPSEGPEVRGPGPALMLALAGRRSALVDLHGAVEVFG